MGTKYVKPAEPPPPIPPATKTTPVPSTPGGGYAEETPLRQPPLPFDPTPKKTLRDQNKPSGK